MDPDCLPAVLVWSVVEEHAIDGIKASEFELLDTLQYVLYMWYNMARKSNVQSGGGLLMKPEPAGDGSQLGTTYLYIAMMGSCASLIKTTIPEKIAILMLLVWIIETLGKGTQNTCLLGTVHSGPVRRAKAISKKLHNTTNVPRPRGKFLWKGGNVLFVIPEK